MTAPRKQQGSHPKKRFKGAKLVNLFPDPKGSYWWECTNCHHESSFYDFVGKGPVVFLWDDLSDKWDQSKLVRKCSACGNPTMRIAFHFPRQEKEKLFIVSIVGLTPVEANSYLPMLWETFPASDPDDRWYHFNYMNGRNNWGLNKPAVFQVGELNRLFDLYRNTTGREIRSQAVEC